MKPARFFPGHRYLPYMKTVWMVTGLPGNLKAYYLRMHRNNFLEK